MSNIQEIPRGQLSTIILMTLAQTDKYGYEIIDDVLKKTDGQMSIKQPSLYSSLKRMEEQSLISSYWRDSDIGGKRHYYHLTDLGKKHLEKWQANITIPIPEPQSETRVLQQENMFNISKNQEDAPKINSEPVQEKTDDSYIQYDLFSSNTMITAPADSISEKTVNYTNSNIITQDTLINQQNQIITKYEDQKNVEQVQKFDYIKKSNKSFADSIKDISNVETKKYDSNNFETTKIISNFNNETPQTSTEIDITNDIAQATTTEFDESISTNKISISELEDYMTETSQEKSLHCDEFTEKTKLYNNDNINISVNTENANISDNQHDKNISMSLDKKTSSDETYDKVPQIKDDGVLITERININDIPKNPRFEARKFEIYISDDTLTPKFKTDNSYEDRIKDLYEKSKTNAENQELEIIDSKIKFNSYIELQEFYNNQNIKFKPFKKTLYKSEKNYDMIRISKLNMLTSLILFGTFSLLSILLGIVFSFINGVNLNSPIVFTLLPIALLLVFLVNFVLYQKSPQKRVAYDINKFKFNISTFILSLLIIPIIIAINILFGFNFYNFTAYSLAIIYPCQLSLIYVVHYFTQKLLIKSKLLF